MKRSPLKSDVEKRRAFVERAQRVAVTTSKRQSISPASPRQRAKVKGAVCIVCAGDPCDPAHLIDRSLCPEGADDPRAVVALCRGCHRLYDEHALSILEVLEPYHREELAYAVLRFGLVATYRRVTGERVLA